VKHEARAGRGDFYVTQSERFDHCLVCRERLRDQTERRYNLCRECLRRIRKRTCLAPNCARIFWSPGPEVRLCERHRNDGGFEKHKLRLVVRQHMERFLEQQAP